VKRIAMKLENPEARSRAAVRRSAPASDFGEEAGEQALRFLVRGLDAAMLWPLDGISSGTIAGDYLGQEHDQTAG